MFIEVHKKLRNADDGIWIIQYQKTDEFAKKYKGRTIKFDGSIDYGEVNAKYSSRFDILLSAGPYSADSQIGPTFKFENISLIFDVDILGDAPDYVDVGDNVTIVAKVDKSKNDILFLEPVSLEYK